MRRFLPVVALLYGTSALAAEPNQVTMQLKEFLDMYEKARKRDDEKPKPPPREYSLSSAKYVGSVVFDDGEPTSASFKGTFRVEVHKDKDWVRVPLLPAQVALSEARIDGRPAAVVLEGGYYTLVTDKRGAFDVSIDFAIDVNTREGSSGFAFNLIPSGSASVQLSVPLEEDLDFVVANAKLQRDRVVGKTRVVDATLPPVGSLSVRWQREIPEAAKEDPRVYAEVYTLVGLGDGLVTSKATVKNAILFAGVDTFEYTVPKDTKVLDVKGAGLRDWTVTDGKLSVVLNYAAENAYTLTVDLERVVGEGNIDLDAPLLIPLGVERSKGWVGVEARGNLEIRSGTTENAAAVDVRVLPPAILGVTDQPVLLGYKYLGTSAKIPLVVTQHDDVDVLVTLLDQAEATTMFTQDGRRLSSVRYEVRNNRRQYLRLELPQGAELWSAAVAGRAVQPAKSGTALLIPLIRSASSGGALASFGVEVVYVETGTGPNEAGRGAFKAFLPKADVPTTYVAWTVYTPKDAKVKKNSFEGSILDVDYLSRPLGAVDALTVQAQQPGTNQAARAQGDSGALGTGAAPVRVRLPVEGNPQFFEKLIALDEDLWVSFDYSGLKR